MLIPFISFRMKNHFIDRLATIFLAFGTTFILFSISYFFFIWLFEFFENKI